SVSSVFLSSRRRHTRSKRDWSSDVCSSDLLITQDEQPDKQTRRARLPGVAADRRRIRAVESRHRGPSQRRLEPGDGEVVLAQMGGEGRGEAREGGGGCGHGEGSLDRKSVV